MPDLDEPSDAPSPETPGRSRRSGNTLAWEPERARRGSKTSPEQRPEVAEPGGPSQRPGDVPASLTRRYFTETLRGGAALAYYEGPGAKRAAFTDHGVRLVSDQTHPAVVRDLVAVAAHRGWSRVRVTGTDDFRREIWMEARALGLEVRGYRPKERDQQELGKRQEAPHAPASEPDRDRLAPKGAERPASAKKDRDASASSPARPDYDRGVAGVLLASGEAPYRRRTGEPVTPFIRIDRGEGRLLDIWGVGLPEALARSGARQGDGVHVRRDGVDVVQRTVEVRDPDTGAVSRQVRDVPRNRWVIDAERFRQATPAQAARDRDLGGAQSHLRVLDSVIDGAIRDPERRARLHAEARELVASELAEGRRFAPARVTEIEPVLAQDLADARVRDQRAERAPQR